jgi:glycosyltransferase involved in cell wall biosynthesis
MSARTPLRIAQVVGASPYGGGTVCILQWSERLLALGHHVTIQTNDPKTRLAAQAIGARAVRIPGMTRPIRPHFDAAAVLALACRLRRERIEVVHTHTSKAGFVGRLAARLAGVPVVVHTVHGFAFHEFTRPARLRLYASLERLAARWCDRIVTVSREHADWAARLGIGGPGQVVAVPNGIALRALPDPARRAQVRRDLGIEDDALLLLSVGRLEAQKNQADLLRAISALGDRLPNAVLAIAGEGLLQNALAAQVAELGLERRVRLLGFRRDVPDLLAAADAFVLSSLWEGMPIVLLEAMAAGLPIVANRIMGNREVVAHGETGYLAPPLRPDLFAEALCELFADRDRAAAMGRAGRRRLERHFTLAQTLAGLEAVYNDVLSRRLGRTL